MLIVREGLYHYQHIPFAKPMTTKSKTTKNPKTQKLAEKQRQPALPPGEDLLVFESLSLAQRPVKIEGKDYILLELNGLERDAYLTFVAKNSTTDEDGNASVTSFNGMQAQLLNRSLFPSDEEGSVSIVESGDKERIPIPTLQTWPASVLQALFEASQALSKLDMKDDDDDDDKDKEGND